MSLSRAILLVPEIVDEFDDPISLALWIFILCKANVTETPYIFRVSKTFEIELKQGQMFLNLKSWAARNGVTYKVARGKFEGIKKGNSVVTETVIKRGIIVTVLNLLKYQTFSNYKSIKGIIQDNSQGTNTGTIEGHPYHTDINHTDKSLNTVAPKNDEIASEIAKPTSTNGSIYSDQFQAFWQAYPRKESKGLAWNIWQRLRQADRAAALEAVPAYAKAKAGQQYIKNPGRWLNDRCWEDDPAAWKSQTQQDANQNNRHFAGSMDDTEKYKGL